ncbi:hypothetical protein BSZ35_06215 [Salinibacter sp. 10B]|uniref:DUF2459 domain-containing protein n=1 Tax=Salinibacter sp. 10B TaxID=1923971 RepID=UPI000CF4BAA8|nr:DUF2459 domain-containing protein [Salinibacter sp. 10B]PQJ34246.1 hypothetical protein BSZ35_06215 [Salinibacter sp. 10B]
MYWWRQWLLLALLGWLLLLATRCHLPRQTVTPTPDSTSTVYLVRHGWHAGIAVRRTDVPAGVWPVLDAFPTARYLEVGWREARYYPGDTRGVWGAFRAGAWPTGSVLHVVPISGSVQGTFPQNTIVRIPVAPQELRALVQYVAESFSVNNQGNAIPAASGYYAGSRFYQSELTYHVFNNCNHWTAGALEAAGCDTAPRWTLTVGRVIAQAEACGTRLPSAPEP